MFSFGQEGHLLEFFGTFSPNVFTVYFFTNTNVLNCELLFRLKIYVSLVSSNVFLQTFPFCENVKFRTRLFSPAALGDAVSQIWFISSSCQLVQPYVATLRCQ